LPLAYFGSTLYGPTGVWMAFPVSNVAGAVLAYLWFRRGTWRSSVVEEKPVEESVEGYEPV
ncbi:MAG: MATE family efflux transporter, partial [Candidatus Nanohaloarchaea archaeon]